MSSDGAGGPLQIPDWALDVQGGAHRSPLAERLTRAKRAFVTRRAELAQAVGISGSGAPRSGDLVLASVLEVGQHTRLELTSGRRAQLYPGDELICAYGERYAPDQFEAVVPKDTGPCDLVAGGGIAAQTRSRHAGMRKATTIAPVGRLCDARGEPLNLSRYALKAPLVCPAPRNLVAVVGTSMNAGKTTVVANLIRGLTQCGIRVGACKVTGTGSGGDIWAMLDAGAVRAIDFTDAGFATTSGVEPEAIDRAANDLVSELENDGVDMVVVEIADGLLQRETAALLSAPSTFGRRLDAVLLAAADSMGAQAGAAWLHARGLPLRAVTGVLTSSPLAAREAQSVMRYEVVDTKELTDSELAARLCLGASSTRSRSVTR